MTGIILRRVEVDGGLTDVAVADGRIHAVGTDLPAAQGYEVIDGDGGALIPGLWDHHIHLLALAAAQRSVLVGPPDVTDVVALSDALVANRPTRPDSWVRGVGYHESVAGVLGREDLDRLLPGAPVRIQDRSGALWMLNSEALHRLGIDDEHRDGLERDLQGRLTGRIYEADRWLRERLEAVAPEPPPDLHPVGQQLAAFGVVGVTDATPYDRIDDLALLAEASGAGDLPQHVVITGGPAIAGTAPPRGLWQGPVKLRLADHALPALDQLVGWITAAHHAGRPVAVHCVTLESLILTLAAIDEAGATDGDRIEHGAVVPPELHETLRRHRLTVVTQPGFIAERGDHYLVDVHADDQPNLYPCATLLRDQIPVAGSTDAPFGHPDPWRAIAAAVDRRTHAGALLGADERVPARQALDLFLGPPHDPGGAPRGITLGWPADLVLLRAGLRTVLDAPHADAVRATIIAGRLAYVGAN